MGAPARELGAGVDDDAAVRGLEQGRVDHVRHRDRVVHRRAVPPVLAPVKAGVEVVQVGDELARACRPSARRSTWAGVISALWVTSRPTIVRSSPLVNTRCAASGSAQMLNSAAGVMLPSPTAPPISTTRSILRRQLRVAGQQQRHVGQRPGRDERHRRGARLERVGDPVDRVRRLGLPGRRRQIGAVEPGLAVDVGGDVARADQRALRAGGDRDVGAADVVEHADRVRRRLLAASGCRRRWSRRAAGPRGWRARASARSRRRGPGRSRG